LDRHLRLDLIVHLAISPSLFAVDFILEAERGIISSVSLLLHSGS